MPESVTIAYERRIGDGQFGSESMHLGITMSLHESEPVEETLNDGATIRALASKVRRLVLAELARSESPRVAAVAGAELNGATPTDDELDLESLPF